MPIKPLTAAEIEEKLDEFLDPVLSSRRTAAGPARALAPFEREPQDFIIHWTGIIAKTNAELAYQFASKAPDALKLLDLADVEDWIIHVMDVYDRKGLYPAVTVFKEIQAYATNVKTNARSITFEDVAGILEPFVRGLTGRGLKLEAGEETYTDTEMLFLPRRIVRFPQREDNFLLYKAMAAHLWAQTWHGSFRAASGEYLSLAQACAHFAEPDKAIRLFHALETIRLDACIERDLAGLARDMRNLRQKAGDDEYPEHWASAVTRLCQPGATVRDTYDILPQLYHSELPTPRCYQGSLIPERVEKVMAERLVREKDAFRTALAHMAEDISNAPQHDSEAEESRDLLQRFSLAQQSDPDNPDQFSFELRLDGSSVTPAANVRALMDSIIQDLGEIPDEYLTAAGSGGYRKEGAKERRPEDVWKGTYHEEGAFLYNEWDYRRQHYRKDWCVLRELNVHPLDEPFVERTLNKYSGLLASLRKTFEVLRGENKLMKKQNHGDDIDFDALVDAHADMRHGREISDRLFTKMHKLERNIAVMFMVDMSGSTKGWVNDAEREALVLLCEALEILGDRYAIYGFSGMTRKRCELYRVKHFAEPYSDLVKRRITGMIPQDYTRMGVTIRHLSKLLNDVEARTKLLITLSDGKPDDYDGYRGDYGIEDTRQALIEAKRDGIHPFCITIDTEARDYLPHMYGPVNYTVIDDVRKLPLRVSDIYRKLTF